MGLYRDSQPYGRASTQCQMWAISRFTPCGRSLDSTRSAHGVELHSLAVSIFTSGPKQDDDVTTTLDNVLLYESFFRHYRNFVGGSI